MTTDLDKERLALLSRRLASATMTRGARWQFDDHEVFTWGTAQGSVRVASRDRDGEPPYELTLYNPAGEKVDELVSELLADDQPAPWNDALVELYRVARRSALGADEIVDALMGALPAEDANDAARPRFLSSGRKGTDDRELA
jgi:hypothetical protein